ncbi:MAG: C-terminal binding protein [Synergistetes bacterium]|nr:C-terminal binding protein [Synergistota bacterium]MCX8128277.1 C-terminal binding protein [Synergistota bacterium]MDW8192590.1 C-terminal binding protein [Synergistota bacterium]
MNRPNFKYKVVVTDYDYPDLSIETSILREIGAEVIGNQCKTEEELIEVAHDAHGILVEYAKVSERVISEMKNCIIIARYGVGVDIVDVKAATKNGIIVTNVPAYCISEVADHALAMFLTMARRIREYDKAVREGKWHWDACGYKIHRIAGMTAGIVGYGRIGSAIASRLKPFGLKILVYDPYADKSKIESDGCKAVSFEELLRNSDVIFIQAPLTEETRGMFNRKAFSMMKQGAFIINTARGPIIENDALYEALSSGKIAGAALDDLEEEPAKQRNWKPINPIFKLSNLVVSPHAAYYSEESLIEARTTAALEVSRALTGTLPNNIVNREVLNSPNLRFRRNIKEGS